MKACGHLLRREGDSNPRGHETQRFSRPSQSSALPSLPVGGYLPLSAESFMRLELPVSAGNLRRKFGLEIKSGVAA